jgi:glutathione-regulated potassium-efflux system ancillary protein KefG
MSFPLVINSELYNEQFNMSIKKNILIHFAHPAIHKSRVNLELFKGIQEIEGVTLSNLYEKYPDFHIDVKHEQDLLLGNDIIIWQHPFYWYSSPSILKEWIDLVLEHGFAYGRKGKALEGKAVFNTITTGGRKEAYSVGGYNKYTINQFMVPFRQTAVLCNMTYLPPFVVHGTHLLTEREISGYARDYRTILISLRDGIFSFDDLSKLIYMNDILEFNEKK